MEEKIIEILDSHLRMMDVGSDCIEVITEDQFEKIAEKIKSLVEKPIISNIVICIDCGGPEEKSKAEWGYNNWNSKKYSSEEHGYVCRLCWNGRSMGR